MNYFHSKKDIYRKGILFAKGSPLAECVYIKTGQIGFTFIAHLVKDNNEEASYSPFISEHKAKELGVI